MNNQLKFSASTSQRWLKCTASVSAIASLGNPYQSNVYAEIGKTLHYLAAKELYDSVILLDDSLNIRVYADEEITTTQKERKHCSDDIILPYLQYVNSFVDKNIDIFIEKQINYKGWTPNSYHGNGYADCIIVDHDKKQVHVFDLKTGNTYVEVKDNSQLVLYALGVYKDILQLDNTYETYYLHIVQPSIVNLAYCKYTLDQLLDFGSYINQQALKAIHNPEFNPNEESCLYCDYKGHCKPLKSYIDKLTNPIDDNTLTHADRVDIVKNKKLILAFIDAVEKETSKIMQEGEKVEGLKLVRGVTHRKWKNESEAALELLKYVDNEECLYSKKLISVTEASKLLKESFSNIESYVIKPAGKLQCTLISDRRKEVKPANDLDWFDELI